MGFRLGFQISTHQQLWLSNYCLRQLSTQGCWTKTTSTLTCKSTEDARRFLVWAVDSHINIPYHGTLWQAVERGVEGGKDAHTRGHPSTPVGWVCGAIGLEVLPQCGARSKGLSSTPASPPDPLGHPPQPRSTGAGEQGDSHLWLFLCFSRGFWVCLLLISLKSQRFGRIPWLKNEGAGKDYVKKLSTYSTSHTLFFSPKVP